MRLASILRLTVLSGFIFSAKAIAAEAGGVNFGLNNASWGRTVPAPVAIGQNSFSFGSSPVLL